MSMLDDMTIPPVPASPPATLEADGKALIKSKTMIGLAVSFLGVMMPAILKAIHAPAAFTSADAMDLLQHGLTFGGMVFAAYGRLVAKQRLA